MSGLSCAIGAYGPVTSSPNVQSALTKAAASIPANPASGPLQSAQVVTQTTSAEGGVVSTTRGRTLNVTV